MAVHRRVVIAALVIAALVIAAALAASAAAGGTTPACRSAQLHGKLYGQSGAAGTIVLSVTLTNTGRACAMKGYVGLRLMASARRPLPTRVVHGGFAILDRRPQVVQLARGATATVWIAYGDVPTGGARSCPASSEILVHPPGDATWIGVPARIRACSHGTLRESPVLAGRRHAP